ncbi:hypothetical protein [Streptomyces beijiangensis]|nr:hypothetical protein [Streptomyces beijiangensis]
MTLIITLRLTAAWRRLADAPLNSPVRRALSDRSGQRTHRH